MELADEDLLQLIIERDNRLRNEGKIEGKIEFYFTEMNLSTRQIADKLSIDEGAVILALNRIGLV